MFEVDPMKISLLKSSIELNSFQSRVKLINKAVSDLQTNSVIYMSTNTSSELILNKNNTNRADMYPVETIRLGDMKFTSDIYLLHVDVEGYEIHVIRSSENLFRNNSIHHLLLEYSATVTDRVAQNDLLSYVRDILGGRRIFALHPKDFTIFGPLYNEDIDQFYSQHRAIELKRDVYIQFHEDGLTIDSKQYDFNSSFD